MLYYEGRMRAWGGAQSLPAVHGVRRGDDRRSGSASRAGLWDPPTDHMRPFLSVQTGKMKWGEGM
jgi:hypothetical protein